MADFLISDWEMEALYGASGAAVKLYLALRSRMDYASCKAGLKTRLSWNALGEAAETHVTRGSGQQIERPTLRQMRTAAEDLDRRGLVRRVGNDELLVFFCCRLPSSNRHVQIKPVRVTSEWRQG